MAKRATSNLPVNYEEQLKNEVSNIQGRIAAPAGDRIRMVNNSHFALPNGQDADALECVVVDFVSANLYFPDAYDKDNPAAPDCFAVGPEPTSLVPSNNSPDKQAETCSVCPNNQFGSSGKGKACKNTRLLAVMPIDSDDDTLFVLSVPPTSIKSFDSYVHTLAGKHRLPPVGVLTKITLDKAVTYASLKFEVQRPLDAATELGRAMEARGAARERLVAEPDFSTASATKVPAKKTTRRR